MQKKLIISDPKIMMGKPIIAGTRITVEMILEKLSTGEIVEDILEAHPPADTRSYTNSSCICRTGFTR